MEQTAVHLSGWAMLARLRAENPKDRYMPSFGRLSQVRFPGGPGLRIDSHAVWRFNLSAAFDPLIAKITVLAPDRPSAANRLRRALEECRLVGTETNLSLLLRVLQNETFLAGRADTGLINRPFLELFPNGVDPIPDQQLHDLVAAAAFLYLRRSRQIARPETPLRFTTGWHQSTRQW
jgi:acetyl/propionyl-CoA carboxylase alpha subunit